METSIFLAKAWGLYLTLTCLAFLVRHKTYRAALSEFAKFNFIFFTGLIALLLGILNILAHNIWTFDWRLIITLLGWLTLARGLFRLFFPEIVARMVQKHQTQNWRWPYVVMVIFLGAGVYLLTQGF